MHLIGSSYLSELDEKDIKDLFSNINSCSFFEQRVENARKILQPFILQRTLKQCAAELPRKNICKIACTMGPYQQGIYRSITATVKNEKAGTKPHPEKEPYVH